MTTLVLRPERTTTLLLELIGAAILVVVMFVTRRYLWLAGVLVAGGIVAADWTARVELVREGDTITITWRNLFGTQRQTALSRIGLDLRVRDDELVMRTVDGDVVLGDGQRAAEVRAFLA